MFKDCRKFVAWQKEYVENVQQIPWPNNTMTVQSAMIAEDIIQHCI